MSKKLPYYLPTEVVLHNKPDDIWVSFLGKVYDVTPLMKDAENEVMARALLAHAGKNISHWFDPRTQDLKKVVHQLTGLKTDYMPHGPIPHTNIMVQSTKWKPLGGQNKSIDGLPWWLDQRYQVGYLTSKARPIRIINVLAPVSHRSNLVWVASEETLNEIVKRIMPFNSNVENYTLKFEGRVLSKHKTLEENEIPDERDKFTQLGLTDDCYIPAIKLYYNDSFK